MVSDTYINGEWAALEDRREVRGPADGSVVDTIGYGGTAEAKAAAAAGEIGALLAAESGKRLPEAVAEVRFAAEYFLWFAEQARRQNVHPVASAV